MQWVHVGLKLAERCPSGLDPVVVPEAAIGCCIEVEPYGQAFVAYAVSADKADVHAVLPVAMLALGEEVLLQPQEYALGVVEEAHMGCVEVGTRGMAGTVVPVVVGGEEAIVVVELVAVSRRAVPLLPIAVSQLFVRPAVVLHCVPQ